MSDDEPGLFDVALAGERVEPPAVELESLGQDARRTLRRAAMLAAGRHPVTQVPLHEQAAPADDRHADGLRCDTCASCWTNAYTDGGSYVKCDAVPFTRGPGSDTRRWYPACTLYRERTL